MSDPYLPGQLPPSPRWPDPLVFGPELPLPHAVRRVIADRTIACRACDVRYAGDACWNCGRRP